ncbi:MAG: LysR family transcriptional regulator [Alphaproteobacteria bacterium]|nr:LysR family transcriptional regulator [Alphaproteobacteria bacterium]
MTSLDDLALLPTLARETSLRSAAHRLDMPVSTLSRRLARLENAVGAPLIRRTPRAFVLTEDGRRLAQLCESPLRDLKEAIAEMRDGRAPLSGELRVTGPIQALRDTIGPWLLAFASEHPQLLLSMHPSDRWLDLVSEGFDLAFRVGPLRDSSDIAIKLWDVPYTLAADSAFLDRYPCLLTLDHPDELAAVPAVVAEPMSEWRFLNDEGAIVSAIPQASARIGDLQLAVDSVQAGLGLGYVPRLMAERAGLKPLSVPGWRPLDREMYAVLPAGRMRSARVQAALDHVRRRYREEVAGGRHGLP